MNSLLPLHSSHGLQLRKPQHTANIFVYCRHFQLLLVWRIWKEINFQEFKIGNAIT